MGPASGVNQRQNAASRWASGQATAALGPGWACTGSGGADDIIPGFYEPPA
jgi:hypothetical protein